eukprot:1391-Pelagococcus_subviridis.AAC.4
MVIPGVERLRTPHVRDAIHRPRDVIHPTRPHAETPHQPRQPADRVKRERPREDVPHVRLLHELIKRLLRELLRVAAIADALQRRLVVQQPPAVRPPKPFVRRVRVLRRVAVLVVVAVRRRPLERVALDRHRAAVRERVLQPLGRRERLVRQLAVVRQRDA